MDWSGGREGRTGPMSGWRWRQHLLPHPEHMHPCQTGCNMSLLNSVPTQTEVQNQRDLLLLTARIREQMLPEAALHHLGNRSGIRPFWQVPSPSSASCLPAPTTTKALSCIGPIQMEVVFLQKILSVNCAFYLLWLLNL